MQNAPAYPDHGVGRGGPGSAAPPTIRRNPLDQIADEHLEQRTLCSALETLAAMPSCPRQSAAVSMLEHLTVALPRHVADEENDLFPLLRRRSGPENEINDTIERLKADHKESERLVKMIVRALERVLATNTAFTADEAADVTAFAALERRHLIVETAIVLPLARVLLTADDLNSLRQRIISRRTAPKDEDS